jgi:hypothetical protein
MTRTRLLDRCLPYLALAAEVILFYRHVLFLGHVIPWDLGGFHLPHAHLYADALGRGELPLWDPYTYCGRPFQANIQTAVFYPTVALAAGLGSLAGHRHLIYLLELNVIFHVLVAGIFAYGLGRAAGLSRPAALVAGTVYQLGGFFTAHAEHMGAVTAAAWLPCALYAILRLSRGFSWRHALLLTVSLALSILAGHTPLAAVVLTASVAFGSLLAVRRPALPLIVIAGCAAAVLLAAVQLGPSVELTRHSVGRYRADWLGTGGGLPLPALVSLVLPNHYGVFDPATYRQPFELTNMYLYSGALTLVCAAAALARRSSLVFILLLSGSALAMLGDATPVGRAAYTVLPAWIRIGLHPEFAAPAFLLSLAVLAGIGLERITGRTSLRWAAVLLTAADLILVSSGRPMNAMPLQDEPGVSRTMFAGHADTLAPVQELARSADPPWRFDTIEGTGPWAMAAPTIQVPSANGNDPLALARLIQVRLAFTRGERWGAYYDVEDLRSPVLAMLNVRYLISSRRLAKDRLAGSPFTLRREVPGFWIYENPAALPRFWLVPRVRAAASESEAASLVRAPGFAPEREAVVEGAPPPKLESGAAAGRVTVLRYGLKDAELEVESPARQFLASSEVHYPGWRAWVDGVEQPVYYTNAAFRGLVVPAGKHLVRWRFEPRLLWWSGLVSLAGWIGVALLWLRRGGAAAVPPGHPGGPQDGG